MGLFRTEAFVLRTVDFSDSAQIASFYSSNYGKFSAFARGVKKFTSKLGPRLEAFALVETRVRAREGAAMGSITSLELLRDWPILRENLKSHALAAVVFETLDRGTEDGKPGAELFHLTLNYLELLGSAGDADDLTIHTMLRLLCLLGFAPDLREEAAGKGKPEAAPWLFFVPEDGRLSTGPPKDSRQPRLRLDAVSREFLRKSMGLSAGEFGEFKAPEGRARPLLDFLIHLAQYYLETELRSARFLRKMIWQAKTPV